METLEETELCFPQLTNTSCRKIQRSHFAAIPIYIIMSSMSLLTATLNLLVIISISHFKQLHTPTNLLLLSLAVSDFFIGFLILFQIMLIDGCWYLGDLMCALVLVFDYIITSASVGNMVLISVDRYVAICEPLHYSTKVTEKRVQVCIYLCWICSVIFHSLVMKDILKPLGQYNSCIGECVHLIHYIAGIADLLLTFIFPITAIIVLYMRVLVVAVSQARAMRSQIAAVPLQRVKVTAKKSELKAARTIGVLVVVFLVCLCPFYCVALTGQDNLMNASSAAFFICLYLFNSCLNPLIYAFFLPLVQKIY
ncbi:trace amine-associated receptor 1-like [Centropristis striata]|uniref:trace amine-associated receptor 1-like n=1 Tax=Centropristis striata TaxID=184440 RepID=UPI0027DFDCFB|nr:trace amine-associated receptor 1-like [Centropristis striata]